jgi:hypothetical protein
MVVRGLETTLHVPSTLHYLQATALLCFVVVATVCFNP